MKTLKILSLTLVMSVFCAGASFAHEGCQKAKAATEESASQKGEKKGKAKKGGKKNKGEGCSKEGHNQGKRDKSQK